MSGQFFLVVNVQLCMTPFWAAVLRDACTSYALRHNRTPNHTPSLVAAVDVGVLESFEADCAGDLAIMW